ncbi:MAG: EAL domain-containing protein [Burkholderiales bacterium]|nr:EAL domain-containing protein [Burkholderiales bacterium]MDE1926877.1 EAL domain-containing protein [Burkholderiales bacterium]MDE2158724.1 EAL domain-containing protein [Burkholderiales bacterium]MDE2501881.1 EAL domain-containing protein [Burkholderiales bacterium]
MGFPSRLLARLSVGRKLLLIFLLDMSAVAYISGILVHEKFIAIDFARKELAGSAYLRELEPTLLALASGRATPAPASITALDHRLGQGLDSARASLDFAAALRAQQAQPADPAASMQALDRGRALLTRVGNQSNLILDPDLDSYYTMSIVVLRIPEILQAAADMAAAVGRGDAGADRHGHDARARFLLLEGRLETGRAGMDSDYGEAIAASDPALALALDPTRRAMDAALDRFRLAARHTLDRTGPAELQAVTAARDALADSVGQAWTAASLQLDRLLEARVQAFFNRMWLHLGTACALLTLILSAVFFVARQIALPLQRLAEITERVRLSGDHSLRAHWDSRDEIGRLVAGFNDMLAQLDRERAAQQELAARARAAQAQTQLVEAIPIPLMVTAIPGHQVLHANQPAQRWLAGSTADPWGRGLEAAVRSRFFQHLADRDAVDEFEVRWRIGDEPSWAVISARQLEFQGQAAVLTAFTPINHLKLMERRLELWAKVFEASGEGILIVDADHHVLTANRAFCRSTGYELGELIGERVLADADAHGASGLLSVFAPALQQGNNWQGEITLQRRDGGSYPAWLMLSVVREGQQAEISHAIATTIDISDRKRNEERIRFLAQHDVLTELPNRSLCTERLRLALQRAPRRQQKVAALFIDLDRFKNINDTLGHHVGDGLLRSVARRLSESVRAGDTVCRLGGDEFVIVLDGVEDGEEVMAIVDDRLVPRIRAMHEVAGAALHVTCSIGIALFPDDAQDLDTLMSHADAAMYQAKAQGRDNARFYSPELNERAQRRLKVESNLRHCLEREELSLQYQPRVDAASGRLLGVEALLRWRSAELGAVAPAHFIPIAEETRLIVPIGAWVIDEACRQFAQWRADGIEVPQVSINVSALQLRDDGLVQTVRAALERHALPPGTVELELTESTLMDRAEQTLARLGAIKTLGVELAIDDFGTGFSSLAYLNRFPIDRLKIDRSFVRSMFENPTDLAITRAIIGLGHTLGLKVVAEGVESEREAQTLRAAGCDELQGYLYARPLTPAALVDWIGRAAPRRAVVAAC